MRSYGQYCGLARAAEVLGERYAMLIVRDLMIGPHSPDQLRDQLGVPQEQLDGLLRDLEGADVIEPRALAPRSRAAGADPASDGGRVYVLTPYGEDLGPALAALGRWGGRRLDVPRSGEVVTDPGLVSALRAGYCAGATRRVAWNIAVEEARAWAVTEPGQKLRSGPGRAEEERAVWMAWADPVSLRRVLAGTLTGSTALESGRVVLDGAENPAETLAEFERAFRIPLDAC